MLCSSCGKENEEGVHFCAYCGNEMSTEAPAVSQAAADEVEDTKQDNHIVDNKPLIFVASILILFVIIVTAYVALFTDLFKGSDYEPPAAATVSADAESGKDDKAAEKTTELSPTYQVPQFTGLDMTQREVENNEEWNKYFIFTFDFEYSAKYDEGIIFEQSIPAGKTVDTGTEIVLTVSKGVETVLVPKVGGMTVDEATKILKSVGLKAATVTVYNDGNHVANIVRSESACSPAEGEVVPVGTTVVLQVYGEA